MAARTRSCSESVTIDFSDVEIDTRSTCAGARYAAALCLDHALAQGPSGRPVVCLARLTLRGPPRYHVARAAPTRRVQHNRPLSPWNAISTAESFRGYDGSFPQRVRPSHDRR